jgi:hypothetical protein
MKEGKVKELLRVWRGMETTTVVRDGETFDRLARTPDRKAETPEKKTQVREMKELIRGLLCELPPLERNIIERGFGFNGYEEEGLNDISGSYGLSRERIRQLKEKGLERIRKRIGEQFDASVLVRIMATRRSIDPAPPTRERKGTLPLGSPSRSGMRARPLAGGTLKMETELTTITKRTLKKLQLMYPHGLDLAVFVANIQDAERIEGRPPYVRIEDREGRKYRLYSVTHSCKERQQALFSSISWNDVDRKNIIGLMSDTDRYYILPEIRR